VVGKRVEQHCVGRRITLADVSADALADSGDRGHRLAGGVSASWRENADRTTRSRTPNAISNSARAVCTGRDRPGRIRRKTSGHLARLGSRIRTDRRQPVVELLSECSWRSVGGAKKVSVAPLANAVGPGDGLVAIILAFGPQSGYWPLPQPRACAGIRYPPTSPRKSSAASAGHQAIEIETSKRSRGNEARSE